MPGSLANLSGWPGTELLCSFPPRGTRHSPPVRVLAPGRSSPPPSPSLAGGCSHPEGKGLRLAATHLPSLLEAEPEAGLTKALPRSLRPVLGAGLGTATPRRCLLAPVLAAGGVLPKQLVLAELPGVPSRSSGVPGRERNVKTRSQGFQNPRG